MTFPAGSNLARIQRRVNPKRFDRHAVLVEHYLSELPAVFHTTTSTDEYVPEFADDLDQYAYYADYLGSFQDLLPSGKVYAIWTTNQTPEDETRDAAFLEALELVAERSGGYIDEYGGDYFYVECRTRATPPAVLQNVIETCQRDLRFGPIYFDEDGEWCFHGEAVRQFNFSKAIDIIGRWFDNHPDAERVRWCGRELAEHI